MVSQNKKNTAQKIQELQILEQTLQNILMQKQAFQLELNETQHALAELEPAKDEVFKVIGQLMIKSNKETMLQELKDKEKMLEIRLKSLEKQESSILEKTEELRSVLIKEMNQK